MLVSGQGGETLQEIPADQPLSCLYTISFKDLIYFSILLYIIICYKYFHAWRIMLQQPFQSIIMAGPLIMGFVHSGLWVK